MTQFKNIELLEEAIESYSLFNKTQKNVLKALVRVNINDYSIISIKDLCQSAKASNTPISNALSFLEKEGIIEDVGRRGIVFTGCKINQLKISDIINRHTAKKTLLEKK